MKSFRQMCADLRRELPTRHPVKIFCRKKGLSRKWLGLCNLIEFKNPKHNYFRITIQANLCRELRHEVLIHEYAHALSWTQDHPSFDDHGPEWGVAYAKCYQVAMDTR